jgi:hypothetical protein
MVATSKNTVFCDVKWCILVDIYRRFIRTFCLHLKLTLYEYTIMIAEKYCSEMSILIHQTTLRHIPKQFNLQAPFRFFPFKKMSLKLAESKDWTQH